MTAITGVEGGVLCISDPEQKPTSFSEAFFYYFCGRSMEFLAGSGHGIETRKAVKEIPPKMTHILACDQPFMFLYQPVA